MTPRGGRYTEGTEADARRHWQKSGRFANAARHDYAGSHWQACCSNAILAAIHAADALCLRYLGLRSSSQDHDDAADLVETIPEVPEATRRGFLTHLQALLETKGLVQYSNREYADEDAELALKHLDRALGTLATVARHAGWR